MENKTKMEDLQVGQIFYIDLGNEKLIKEGVAHKDGTMYDQRYDEYTPCKLDDKWYMLNTYQISGFNTNGYESDVDDIDRFINFLETKPERAINHSYSYFYTFRVPLTQEILDLFEYKYNLRDYKVVSKWKGQRYNRENEDVIFNVRLQYEHNYPNGITIVRKAAKYDISEILIQYANDMRKSIDLPRGFLMGGYKEKRAIEDGVDPNHEIFKEYEKLGELLTKQEEEIKEFFKNGEWLNEYGGMKYEKINELLGEE